jgi:hypothetical protein
MLISDNIFSVVPLSFSFAFVSDLCVLSTLDYLDGDFHCRTMYSTLHHRPAILTRYRPNRYHSGTTEALC